MSIPSPAERTWLDVVPVIATAAVALAAAVLAADASREVAISSGAVSDPALAWCVPVIIEGGAVTSGLLAWRRSRMGQPARPERLMLLVLVLLAVVVNAAHAASGTPLGWVIAAAPPLVLVVSVELLLRNRAAVHDVSAALADRERAKASRAERQRQRLSAPAPRPSDKSSDPPLSPKPRDVSDRVAEVAAWLADGEDLTGKSVGDRLGCSPATGRRVLAQAREISAA